MFLSNLLPSLLILELINASQEPLDVNFQANFSAPVEQAQLNSTIQNLAADFEPLESQEHVPLVHSSPWTHDPECLTNDDASEEYCVYTNTSFAKGRGISFFTSPKISTRITQLPAFTNATIHDHTDDFEDPPWEIRNIPGRGNGLFAIRTLYRGDPIIAQTPVAVLQSDAFFLDYPLGYRYLHTAFDRLPDTTRDIVMRTATHSHGDPYMERINTNAFAGDFEGEPHFLLYPETALMNHDCRPNTLYYHDTSTLIHATYASRTIHPGEEITITYINILAPRSERRAALQQTWNFHCECSLCSESTSKSLASDTRISRITILQSTLADSNSLATPAMAEELIKLYDEEGVHAAKGLGHMLAALAYNAEGDVEGARRHSKQGLEWGVVTDGEREGSMKDLVALRDEPGAHWSFERRKRLKEGGGG